MKKIPLIILVWMIFICIYGCRSIHVGGSGEVGGVYGGGAVTIPIPRANE